MIEEQKGKWDGKMSADSMLKEERERERERGRGREAIPEPISRALVGGSSSD